MLADYMPVSLYQVLQLPAEHRGTQNYCVQISTQITVYIVCRHYGCLSLCRKVARTRHQDEDASIQVHCFCIIAALLPCAKLCHQKITILWFLLD